MRRGALCYLVSAMNLNIIIDGLLQYICLVILLTFHEFAHAWVASKCGDDTARLQGRVSLNPIVHMDLIGTVILPLAALMLAGAGSGLASFIIGWGRPVPVDMRNLRKPRRDDTLIALAVPAMNLVLAFALMGVVKGFAVAHMDGMLKVTALMIQISLILCFFNLLPIPPLDGSHVLKNLIGMADETYFRLCQFGFVIVIVAIQIPFVRHLLGACVSVSMVTFAKAFRV